jgi:hypothetical protein
MVERQQVVETAAVRNAMLRPLRPEFPGEDLRIPDGAR